MDALLRLEAEIPIYHLQWNAPFVHDRYLAHVGFKREYMWIKPLWGIKEGYVIYKNLKSHCVASTGSAHVSNVRYRIICIYTFAMI